MLFGRWDIFFLIFLFFYLYVCLSIQSAAFSMRSMFVERDDRIVIIYEALCFDVAQGQMNGATNETQTHSSRFASLAY